MVEDYPRYNLREIVVCIGHDTYQHIRGVVDVQRLVEGIATSTIGRNDELAIMSRAAAADGQPDGRTAGLVPGPCCYSGRPDRMAG
jgi:hypothetical protein